MKLPRLTRQAPSRLKLIFNPISGVPGQSPAQLMEVVREIQAAGLTPEVYLVEPDDNLKQVVEDALQRGFRTFVVSGGDGTIDTVAGALVGTHATLAVIPTGTQNNVALSLGIPADIPGAVGLLTNGERIKVDIGIAVCDAFKQPFLEVCSVGLLSALFPAADDIQHGNLARIADLLSTLVTFPPAEMRLVLDRKQEINTQGHVVLVGNMPYIGPHFQVDPDSQIDDGLLEVLVFANLTKLDLIGNAVQIAGGSLQDPRIQRYHVRSVSIETNPPMPVLVDGFALGEGTLNISVNRHALRMMAGPGRKLPELAAEAEAGKPETAAKPEAPPEAETARDSSTATDTTAAIEQASDD